MKHLQYLFLLVGTITVAQDINTFRKTYWGMNRAEVISSENPRKPVANKPDRVDYGGIKIGEATCKLFYEFNDSHLAHAQYYYHPESASEYGAITFYMDMDESLTKKYGHPLDLESMSLDELAKKAPGNSGNIAILDGDQIKSLKAWETPSTLIIVSYWERLATMKGQDVIMVDYYSKFAKPREYNLKRPSLKDL